MAKLDTSTIQTSGDLGGEQINMSLDTDSLVHIIGSIASLYGDIKEAIVRELITNAIDSHIEAGNPNPIYVTTPSQLSPYLVIKDCGLGMSRAEVESVWAKVGYSTKRNSNATAGRYGYGRISPLAYGSQSMTVVTVKNGEKTTFVVGSDATSGGLIEVVDVSQTDEPNGYTASVLVSDPYHHGDFNVAAKKFAKFSSFPVTVNGEPAEQPVATFYNGVFKEFESVGYSPTDYAVQGNVSYPIDISRLEYKSRGRLSDNGRITCVYVDVGELDVTPSRDGLKYTKKTIDNLNKYYSLHADEKYKEIKRSVENAPSPYEAVRVRAGHDRWLTMHGYDADFVYKGHKVPRSRFDTDLKVSRVSFEETSPGCYEKVKRQKPRVFELAPKDGPSRSIVILNHDIKSFTRVHLAKTIEYAKRNKINLYPFAPIDVAISWDDSKFFWCENAEFIEWEDIKSIKVQLNPLQAQAKKVKEPRKWEGIGGDAKRLDFIVPDKTKEILYISKTQASNGARHFHENHIADLHDDNTQVFLVNDSNRERFLDLYPKAKPAYTRYQEKIESYLDNLTPEDIMILQSEEIYGGLGHVSDQIEDPELRAALYTRSTRSTQNKVSEARIVNRRMLNLINRVPGWKKQQELRERFPKQKRVDLSERYPLLTEGRVYNSGPGSKYSQHALKYCNEIYREMKKNGEL